MKSILNNNNNNNNNNKFKTSMIVKTLTIVLLTIFSTSCSKKEDEIVTPAIDYSTAILGKWEYSKEGTFVNGIESALTDYIHQTGCSKDSHEFKSDKNLIKTKYFRVIQAITGNVTCRDTDLSLNYVTKNKTLELTLGTNNIIYEIIYITPTELKYRGDGKVYVFNKV